MKFGFLLLILISSLLLCTSFAQASDVSCQVDLLKPKFNAAVLEDEADKPAKLTVSEARIRLKKSQAADDDEQSLQQNTQETAQTNSEKASTKTAKKSSGLGGIFDILLPSKLRNPVK